MLDATLFTARVFTRWMPVCRWTPADGKVSLFRDRIRLFADGASISQLMTMNEPYLDGDGRPDSEDHGEWMM